MRAWGAGKVKTRRGKPIANATALAKQARRRFCTRKQIMLETFVGDHVAARKLLVVLEGYYAHLAVDYTKRAAATAAAWQAHGPEVELEEVREAVKGAEAFARLLAKYPKRGGAA